MYIINMEKSKETKLKKTKIMAFHTNKNYKLIAQKKKN